MCQFRMGLQLRRVTCMVQDYCCKQLAMAVSPFELAELNQPLLLSLLAICLSSFLLALVYFTHYRKYSSHNLPPGSFGLPLIGETFQFAFCNNCPAGTPPPFYTTRLQRYGTNVFKSHLMGRPTIVSMDPELNKLLLANDEKLVKAYWPSPMGKIFGPITKLLGDQHRQLREFASIALNPVAIQTLHVDNIQELALSILGSWPHKMPLIEAQQEIKQFVLSYDAWLFLGLEANNPAVTSLLQDYNTLSFASFAVPIDLPGTSLNKVLKARKNIISLVKNQVKLRKNEVGRADEPPKDFLDIILKKNDISTGRPLTEDLIAEIYFSFLLAGFDTTSALIVNLIKFLSKCPHVVDELRKEHISIRSTKTMDEKLTWNDYKKMHFTDLVVKEALRLGNIAHMGIRESLQDIIFKDIVIPKGWMVLMSFAMVHLNPKYYPNPSTFDPWRWKDTANNDPAFLTAFGGGPRICLGSTLAKYKASIFLHYLVTRYTWERVYERDGEVDEFKNLTFSGMHKGLFLNVEHLST